jgi:signal peptidase I
MQCTNCGFQNMPGSDVCGRCATSLGLATAVLDVHPPRAGALTKRARRLLPVRKAYFRTRDALHTAEIAARARQVTGPLPAFPVLARLIVPGWPHFYLKQYWRGAAFLLAYVACIVPALLLFGSMWGSIWLGLAFSVHSSAGLNIITQTFAEADVRGRIGRSIVVSLVLWMLVYWPAVWMLGRVADPHTVQTALGQFQSGDIIWVNHRKTPARGDVVLYDTGTDLNNVPREGHRPVIVYTGENIDRILAVPGDVVECRAGQLFVNGAPSAWLPLYPRKLPDSLNWSVPVGQYLIVPSGVRGMGSLEDPMIWQTTGSVPRENIAGRAWLQSLPLSRFHVIR